MNLLSVEKLSVSLSDRSVLKQISFAIKQGECVGLIGPNGAGKSTLLRASLGLIPFSGLSSLASSSAAERARLAVWMPQAREIAWPVTVETVVMLGRMPHRSYARVPSLLDQQKVATAITAMDLDALRDRPATELSGGEQARVLIARALAQDAPLILADEPVAGLDPSHQIATMNTFAELAKKGRGVLVSLHDLGLAARHCTRLIMLDKGQIVADGTPQEVLTLARLEQVFNIDAFYQLTENGPVFQPLGVKE